MKPRFSLTVLATVLAIAGPAAAQLLDNLQGLPHRVPVGDPAVAAAEEKEGPKGIATADFNGDGKPDLAVGNLDGTITVLLGLGDAKFAAPRHLRTGAAELRNVLAADLDGDGDPDLAAASPVDGKLMIYFNPGGGVFGSQTLLPAWIGVRSLASGDFDGDGIADLAAAGPGRGVRHYRGIGQGLFEIMGDLRRLSPSAQNLTQTRPVYSMHTMRSQDRLRDDLLVTHAETPTLWILSTRPADVSHDAPVDPAGLPGWRSHSSPVLLHEVQVHNSGALLDAEGSPQPWAELLNKSASPINLAGWKLQSSIGNDVEQWVFPSATIEPGRFLIVFLSGKNRRTGPELHTSFALGQSTDELHLIRPDNSSANSIDLEEHTLTAISRGLAPDSDDIKWFDIPSPNAENNAGLGSLDDLRAETMTTLEINPLHPAPGQPVTVRVTMPTTPTGAGLVRNVWFSSTPKFSETHHLMHRVGPGVFEEVLPDGAFTGTTPHRVLARFRERDTEKYYTIEAHRGLDEPESEAGLAVVPGCLQAVASVPSPKVKAFAVGPTGALASLPDASVDLVYADDEGGRLRVHRAGPGMRRFRPIATFDVPLNGAPRDVKLTDTDGDGWLDAVAVLELKDLAVTCRNESGSLRATGELPTGRSPREITTADFTGDGRPDAAVINRRSADVSILPATNANGLVSLDQIYRVDGEVAGLIVRDLNGDGRDDVLQLHRASGEISTRYAGPDGLLGEPVFSSLGAYGASAVTLEDVNNDGLLDALTANLGQDSAGTISVLLAREQGAKGPAVRAERRFDAPRFIQGRGPLFAIAVADFDNDGHKDVVAGHFDCTVDFFFGNGQGDFEPRYEAPMSFTNEARGMVTADFDRDGDIDIAGAGYEGDMVTLTNNGAATAASWERRLYPRTYPGTERISLVKLNNDSLPDLLIGTGRGVITYQNRSLPGILNFTLEPSYMSASGVAYPVSDVLATDLDDDDKLDMVTACLSAACINILGQDDNGRFVFKSQADVPSGRYLAAGDLDGDGKPDLVGTGDVLWTVLSGRKAQDSAPEGVSDNRPKEPTVVINEILARNRGIPVPADNFKNTDYIELFNGSDTPADLGGWTLEVQSNQEGTPVHETWTLPATTVPSGSRVVLLCVPDSIPPPVGSMRTGFVLPAEGGFMTLRRTDANRSVADHVSYPSALENVSWGRFLDGHRSFCASPVPSPGRPNLDSGRVPPDVTLTPPAPSAMRVGAGSATTLRFTARGRDDLGIISMSLVWNRLKDPYPGPKREVLLDNGQGTDAAALDGLFTGEMPGLLAGTDVQFYLEAVDLSGEVIRLPEAAVLTGPGVAPVAWSFSLTPPASFPSLRITEVCTDNTKLLRDENGGKPDYVKVRNTGSARVEMGRILLAKSPLSANSEIYSYPDGLALAPGAEVTVFADGNPAEGRLHAPFTLQGEGDDLALLATTPSGARQWIHSLAVPALPTDFRLVELAGTDLHAEVAPAADLANWTGTAWDANGVPVAAAQFVAAAGTSYTIEGDAPGAPVAWAAVGTVVGDGMLHTITRPFTETTALRIIPSTGLPTVRVDAVIPGVTNAGIYGDAPGATTCTLFYGRTDGAADHRAWDHEIPSDGRVVEFVPDGLTPATRYFYRLRAQTPAGDIWSPPSTSFATRPSTANAVTSLELNHLSPTSATIGFAEHLPGSSPHEVLICAGTTDALDDLPAWETRVAPAWNASGTRLIASLASLVPETEYTVRAFVRGVVSPVRLRFRTPSAVENLARNLLLTEIMYNPSDPTVAEQLAGFDRDDFEFIELQNASNGSLDLGGLWFEGIAFDFPPYGAPVLSPGGFAVIASNPHAFAMRYGDNIPLAGWTLHPFRDSRLANDGEDLTLHAADGTTLFNVAYTDIDDRADRGGYSLEYWPPSGPHREELPSDYSANRGGGSPGRASPWLPLPYNEWKARIPGGTTGDPAASGAFDYDGDGLPNLVEYACGTDPLSANTSPLGLSVVLTQYPARVNVTFPVSRSPTETKMTLEASSGGVDWSTVGFIAYRTGVGPAFIPDPDYRFAASSWGWTAGEPTFFTTAIHTFTPPPEWFFRLRVAER